MNYENQFIEANYLTMPVKRIASELKRSQAFVLRRIKKLGLVIPREIIEQRKNDSQIKKGSAPPNKGKKMPPELYEKAKATMFKKGNTPHNTKWDGYISIRIDNHGHPYKHVRISKGKFELLHRKIWMDAYGPIPPKMQVSFRNGDTLDCRLENLELISMAENMKRNTLHNYPEDIRHNIQLIGALNRVINKRTKS